MSEKYPEYPYTNFPEELDTFEEKMDVTADLYNVVAQYKTLCSEGNYDSAKELLKNNQNLQKMIIDAMTINELQHAVMAIEKMWKEDLRDYVVKRVFDGDINIGEYTHTYDSSTKTHNFAGDGKNAKVLIVEEFHVGDKITLNGEAATAYMGGKELSFFNKGSYMYFTLNDHSLYFTGDGDMTTSSYDPDGSVLGAGGVKNFVNNTISGFNAVSCSLKSSAWSSDIPHTQTIKVNGMTENWIPGTPSVLPYENISADQMSELKEQFGRINMAKTSEGGITFYCYEDAPTWDLNIRVPRLPGEVWV